VVEQGEEDVLDGGILQVDGRSSVGVLEGFVLEEKNVRPEVDGVGAAARACGNQHDRSVSTRQDVRSKQSLRHAGDSSRANYEESDESGREWRRR
jgi:hypothetical protein